MTAHSISVIGVKKVFVQGSHTTTILKGVDAVFTQGSSDAITGVSGSGKSSLLHIIAGFDTPSEGTVLFDDKPLHNFSVLEKTYYAQKVIGFLFQKPYLIKELSVIENVMLPAQVAGHTDREAYERALELLTIVGLASYKDHKPGVLSGGQQQRVCLVRALCNKPFFLCADEPTASLDHNNRDEMVKLIKYAIETWNMGVIICTHDMVVAQAMQHVLILHDGVLCQSGM